MIGSDHAATRLDLQRVATHVLARRRHDVTGRFGLRATPGGLGTPAFGTDDAVEVLRLTPTHLVHERGGDARAHALAGASLADLAALAGVELDPAFSVGHDTPVIGDPSTPLTIDPAAAAALADWLHLGWQALDAVAAVASQPATIQLWPEHFDAGTNVAVGPAPDDRVNLGVSLGDGFAAEPYLYVGPWGADRPGESGFWNAPFGAVRTRREVGTVEDAVDFLHAGLRRFTQ